MIITNIITIFLFFCSIYQTKPKSLKIGNTTNDLIQTGDVTFVEDYLTDNQTIYYQHTLAYTMDASLAEVSLGLIGGAFDIQEDEIGWQMQVVQIKNTAIEIGVTAHYFPNTIANIKIRYIVSVHPLLYIQYIKIQFDTNDNVEDVYQQNSSTCSYIYCRTTTKSIAYRPKNNQHSIKGIISLVGFYAHYRYDPDNVTDILGIDEPEYFGIDVTIKSLKAQNIQVNVTINSFASLLSVSFYHITYESTITNTQTTRTISGQSKIGCYYDENGCDPTTPNIVNSNNSFQTGQTWVQTYYEQNYFYGLSFFVVQMNYQGCQNPIPISAFTFTSQQLLNIQQIQFCFPIFFDTSNKQLSGHRYNTDVSFYGNNNQHFSMGFSYLIDISFQCPSTGDIYYQKDKKYCDDVCNNDVGQYPNTTDYQCYDCDSQCRSCTGPSDNQCKSCRTGNHKRTLNGTFCQCQDGYFDNLVEDKCVECHVSCKTCFGDQSSMCLSCEPADKRYDDMNSSCPCIDGYYHNNSETCVKCHYTCETCTGGQSNKCVTCDSNNYRLMDSSNKCLCIQRYYNQNNKPQCQPCHYSCFTCSKATQCTSCNATSHRTKDSDQCLCDDYFYDDGSNQLCLPCHVTCLKCNGPTRYDCIKCDAALNKGLVIPQQLCLCVEHYFEFNFDCFECHYTCLNCSDSQRGSCINCDISNHRLWNSTTSECQCEDSFYDDYHNSDPECQPCDSRCLTCQQIDTKCLTCDPVEKRQLSGEKCPCIYGYVQMGIICKVCHYSCETCTSDTDDTCIDCNTTIRFLDNNHCLCRTGTFDNGIEEDCKTCHQKCVQCINPDSTGCLQCDPALYRIDPATFPDACPCQDSYYDIIGDPICHKCDDICATCKDSSDFCLSCDPAMFRELEPVAHQCVCKSGYFDDGSLICLVCADQCLKCQYRADNCTECDNLLQLVPGTVIGVNNNKCKCISGYYQDLMTGDCLQCDHLCQTCQNSSTTCLTCISGLNRIRDGTDCICQNNYYDDGISLACQPCPYFCPDCNNGPVCITCADVNREISNNCACKDGYYNDGTNPICLLCEQTCKTCLTFSVCKTCDPSQHRWHSVDECICQAGFYEELNDPDCKQCHYSCETCDAGSQFDCQICKTGRTEDTITFECICSPGTYEAVDLLCHTCDIQCKQCSILPDNCTACHNSLVLENNTCVCPDSFYYDSGTLNCQPCDLSCKECQITPENCLQCYETLQLTYLSGSDCVCYPSSYWDISTQKCELCHVTCKQCTGPNDFDCIQCYQSSQNRSLDSNLSMCLCSPGYFSNIIDICELCEIGCSECYGGSRYQCTACSQNYTLIGTYCREKVVCLNYVYNGKCIDICPQNTYPVNDEINICQRCVYPCVTCISQTHCLSCTHQTFYRQQSHECLEYCPKGNYIDQMNQCVICPDNCTVCTESPVHDQPICIECNDGFIIVDGIKCMGSCPQLTHVMDNNYCLKCIGNCETCSGLSTKKCLTCKKGTKFLENQCFTQCPFGYYEEKQMCLKCNQTCKACYKGQCWSCQDGYYLSSNANKCIAEGFFYDKNNETSKCHPNCLICTDSSFSSCTHCPKMRGNPHTNKAIDGYCTCQADSIDIGEGICDIQSYKQVTVANQVLLSSSYSTFFMAGLTSIISSNFLLGYSFLNYMQTYSAYYYVNSTTSIMKTDMILSNYRMTNIITWQNSNPENYPNKSSRNLQQTVDNIWQNNQSLFLRGNSVFYLIQLSAVVFWIVVTSWIIDLVLYLILRCCGTKNKVYNQNELMEAPNDFEVPPFQIEELDTSNKHPFTKSLTKFYKIYHQSVQIIIHICTSTEVTLLATISFKIILTSSYQIDYSKLIPSIMFALYIVGYTIRLLVLTVISKKVKDYRNIKILFAMHEQEKLKHPIHRIYIPMIIFKNQLAMIFIVCLSGDPISQIASSGCVYLVFTLYSVFACPYPICIRIFIHLQQLLFLGQIIALVLTISSTFLDYTAAFILLTLNFIQLVCFLAFSIVTLVYLVRDYLCKTQKEEDKQEKIEFLDDKENHKKIEQSMQTLKISEQSAAFNQIEQTQFNLNNLHEKPDSIRKENQFSQKNAEQVLSTPPMIPEQNNQQKRGVIIKKYRIKKKKEVQEKVESQKVQKSIDS